MPTRTQYLGRRLSPASSRSVRLGHRTGFTLTEILIAVALGLLLLIGVAQIFTMSGNTISQGYALGELTRRERSLANVFRGDILGNNPGSASSGILPAAEQPLIVIRSERQVIFRDRADLEADIDNNNASGLALNTNAYNLNDSAQTVDLNADGDTNDAGEDLSSTPSSASQYDPTAVFNQGRNHRKDVFGFFTRGLFKRQTGQPADLANVNEPLAFNTGITIDLDGNGTRQYAYVWYGHMRLPDNSPNGAGGGIDPRDAQEDSNGDFHGPGAANPVINPNNYFPTQWTLGRFQVILDDEMPFEPSDAASSQSTVQDRTLTTGQTSASSTGNPGGYAPYVHLGRNINLNPPLNDPTQSNRALEPFGYGTRAGYRLRSGPVGSFSFSDSNNADLDLGPPYASNIIPEIQHGFYDYAARRISGLVGPRMYRELLDTNSPDLSSADTGWWRRLIYNYDPTQSLSTGGFYIGNNPIAYRFNANPFVKQPLDWQSNAQNQAILFRGCSQFIVEYAGDYVTQENDPTQPPRDDTVTAVGPDGVIDFFIRRIENPDGTETNVREIAWYGMARDVDGDGTYDVRSLHESLAGGGAVNDNTSISATPADVKNRRVFPGASGFQNPTLGLNAQRDLQRFERSIPRSGSFSTPLTKPTLNSSLPSYPGPDVFADDEYVAVWGPKDLAAGQGPKLIRLTVQMLDPNGRIPAGLTREFVYRISRD